MGLFGKPMYSWERRWHVPGPAEAPWKEGARDRGWQWGWGVGINAVLEEVGGTQALQAVISSQQLHSLGGLIAQRSTPSTAQRDLKQASCPRSTLVHLLWIELTQGNEHTQALKCGFTFTSPTLRNR